MARIEIGKEVEALVMVIGGKEYLCTRLQDLPISTAAAFEELSSQMDANDPSAMTEFFKHCIPAITAEVVSGMTPRMIEEVLEALGEKVAAIG